MGMCFFFLYFPICVIICLLQYTYCKDGTKKPYLDQSSALFPIRFTSINASYGKLFLVSDKGELYAFGETSNGECGEVQSAPASTLRRIELVAALSVCPHDIAVTSSE